MKSTQGPERGSLEFRIKISNWSDSNYGYQFPDHIFKLEYTTVCSRLVLYFSTFLVCPCVIYSSQSGQNVSFIRSQYSIRFGHFSGKKKTKKIVKIYCHLSK